MNTAGIRDAWRVGGFVQEGEERVPIKLRGRVARYA